MVSLVQSILCFALVYFAQAMVLPAQNPVLNSYFPNDFPGNMGGPLLGGNGISGQGAVDKGSNGINGEGNTIGSPSSNAFVSFTAAVNGNNSQQTSGGSSDSSSGSSDSSSGGSSGSVGSSDSSDSSGSGGSSQDSSSGGSGGSSSRRKRDTYVPNQVPSGLNGQPILDQGNTGLYPSTSNQVPAATVDSGSTGINGANNTAASPSANAVVYFVAGVSGSNNQTSDGSSSGGSDQSSSNSSSGGSSDGSSSGSSAQSSGGGSSSSSQSTTVECDQNGLANVALGSTCVGGGGGGLLGSLLG